MEDQNKKECRLKNVAELINENDGKIFILDYYESIYFADIVEIKEKSITISCFAPNDKYGKVYDLFYIDIKRMAQYRTKQYMKNVLEKAKGVSNEEPKY